MILDEMINSGYFGYITEAEGITSINSSRATKINAIIKDFKYLVRQGKDPNNYIDSVLEKYGLDQCSLTPKEISKINEAVNGY